MSYNKVDLSLNMSVETAARFVAITDAMNFTNEQALSYLLDLHDKVGPKRDGFPEKRRTQSHLHTCVQPEIRSKFRQLAREYDLSYDQLLTMLIDLHDERPERASGPAERPDGAEDAGTGGTEGVATMAGHAGGDAMAKLETALDMIRDAFLSAASESDEVNALREQLAQSQAETRKAKAAYQRKLRAVAAQLQELA